MAISHKLEIGTSKKIVVYFLRMKNTATIFAKEQQRPINL